jgi:hypothetical protein
MSYAYKNLRTYANAGSGIAEYALLAPKSWFDVGGLKYPVGPFGVTPGDEITITEPHVFLAGKGFIYFTLAPQKNQMDGSTVGDFGFNKQNYQVKLFVPGSTAQLHETMKNLMNTPLVGIFKDANCDANLYYQLGSDCVSGYLTADFSTGTTKDGVKGYNATFNYEGGLLIYGAGEPAIIAD